MSEFLKAFFSLLFFIPYTTMPRFMEVMFGISAWVNLIVLIEAIKEITWN